VLAVPLRVQTDSLARLKFDWMRSLCDLNQPSAAKSSANSAGLYFAGYEINANQNSVVRYNPKAPTLGVIAARVDSDNTTVQNTAHQICKMVLEPERRWMKFLLSTAVSPGSLASLVPDLSTKHFNSKAFSNQFQQLVPLDRLAFCESVSRPQGCVHGKSGLGVSTVKGRVVFLGAALTSDQIRAPLGGYGVQSAGVVVHSATYYSAREPVTHGEGVVAFAVDFFMGILAAQCFGWLWHRRKNAHADYHLRRTSLHFLKAMEAHLTLYLSAVVLVLLLLIVARVLFFPFNVWVNPTPIVLGVLAKFVLAGRDHEVSNGHVRETSLAKMTKYGALALAVFLVVWPSFSH
jgi:hypothetical protein